MEYLARSYRQQLLHKAIVNGDFVLASGEHAQQKFEFDNIETDSIEFQLAISGLEACIRDRFSGYDGILTVANGATRLGHNLAENLGVIHLNSSYAKDTSGNKKFSVSSRKDADKVVIVDDVFTRGTNATKVKLAAEDLGIKTLGAAVILDRSGKAQPTFSENLPVGSVIRQTLE